MGTRGYRVVRYRGRYFVYYNHLDSYPEHFGKQVVSKVPVDRKEYEEWLQQERATYERRLVELEEHLCITEEQAQILVGDGTGHEDGAPGVGSRLRILDTELLTCHFGEASNDLFIEWVYIIDLDQQIFSVNNEVYFRLWNIPRDTWIEVFYTEKRSTEKCPEATLGQFTPSYFTDHAECERYNEVYKGYQCSELYSFSGGSNDTIRQVVGLMLYEYLLHPSHSQLWDFYSQWASSDFAFRELAFAILSLAAGEFCVTDVRKLYGNFYFKHRSHGFMVAKEADDETEIIPILGSGCHTPGTKPGCAPADTMYYFQGILISLVTADALFSDRDAAIAKAVEFGLQSGKKGFDLILFSIKLMIVVKVSMDGDVTSVSHSEVLPLTNGQIAPMPPVVGTKSAVQGHPGFAILQMMFDIQSQKYVQRFSQGVFPSEIYTEIMSYVIDPQTELTCSKVAPPFRNICQGQVAVPQGLATSFAGRLRLPENDKIPYLLVPFGTFTFKDKSIATTAQPGLCPWDAIPSSFDGPEWCAIIGYGKRKCIISQAHIPIIATNPSDEDNVFMQDYY
ncbi:hypothetical protein MGYG_05597 [Nannizzia gypsea CBS 118893]|uniref:Uncharacterized protein n=1 Tax=Arthroderma gypseum (strain ATCC MYA-4604 / CBS 118893) TaxID=535722 RepID=E4UWQ7_ARTGP|nr:hypothetical protein MGYG_05597 [Nannizzia gypsea CBS 118893]EFR02600.1 hypothetical protein MGYG_05597 [Nannizzia gypsea CBS 118893]